MRSAKFIYWRDVTFKEFQEKIRDQIHNDLPMQKSLYDVLCCGFGIKASAQLHNISYSSLRSKIPTIKIFKLFSHLGEQYEQIRDLPKLDLPLYEVPIKGKPYKNTNDFPKTFLPLSTVTRLLNHVLLTNHLPTHTETQVHQALIDLNSEVTSSITPEEAGLSPNDPNFNKFHRHVFPKTYHDWVFGSVSNNPVYFILYAQDFLRSVLNKHVIPKEESQIFRLMYLNENWRDDNMAETRRLSTAAHMTPDFSRAALIYPKHATPEDQPEIRQALQDYTDATLPTQEAADYIGVSRRTLMTYVKDNKLAHQPIPEALQHVLTDQRSHRYPLTTLNALKAANEAKERTRIENQLRTQQRTSTKHDLYTEIMRLREELKLSKLPPRNSNHTDHTVPKHSQNDSTNYSAPQD